jgi:mRNA interferase MazF
LTSPNPPPARGEVWLIDFDPTLGDEKNKIRPAVVISSDAFTPLETKIVVPLTSWHDKHAGTQWMVKVEADKTNMLENTSTADTLQLRCVSYKRFVHKIGKLSSSLTDEIAAAIAIVVEYQ